MTKQTSERRYWDELSLVAMYRYLRGTYGVQPLVAVHITENEKREQLVVVTAGLRNMVERAEWGQPDDVILTRRYAQVPTIEGLVGDALWRLLEVMKQSAQ